MGFRFIIHGHRHEPRITRHSASGVEQLVFAAGAFSAQLEELASRTRNLFHYMELNANNGSDIVGDLRTWAFSFGTGWREATPSSAAIPFLSSLTSPRPEVSLTDLMRHCDESPAGIMRVEEIKTRYPQLLTLLPSELIREKERLSERGYKLTLNEEGQIHELGKVAKHD